MIVSKLNHFKVLKSILPKERVDIVGNTVIKNNGHEK